MVPYCRCGQASSARRQHVFGLRKTMFWLGVWLLLCISPARAEVPEDHLAALRRGINITNWFRFPADTSKDRLRDYLPDTAMTELHQAGFTFVRLCIQPQFLLRADGQLDPDRLAVVLDAVRRLQRAGLAVVVDAHPESWRIEEDAAHRQGLLDFWRQMAPALRSFDPRRTFPEVMNEPVVEDHAAWSRLQEEALAVIRAALPDSTVILTGADWGSIDGLSRLQPVRDRRVIYSVHEYDPKVLTTFAFWEQGLDTAMLARLPFPVQDTAACEAIAAGTSHGRTQAIAAAYCAGRWNPGRLRDMLGRAAAWGRQHNVPVGVFEFGAHARLNESARLGYLAAFRKAAEEYGMPWAIWGYGDIMGFPVQTATGRVRLDLAVLRALGLPGGR
ncbi:hypothetical protein GCM10011504_35460 [Siccirubricoccus deserti]|uniref:Cellulase family glycosylhydrolase n=1 Tax=Siccirubricoccus deserti TaxID=2013562 RepID=A0A9X0UIB8_9PROT|nr:cellulase family glycosylhydrolase [Siccirubricoccus deserti]MBC4016945.1 cellulase family glycosylhydrolase [Siccirubricoccus deserti]GGC53978.1 hypothetical protein GCM10011504_35460 [Siccirubricoccus deserti]